MVEIRGAKILTATQAECEHSQKSMLKSLAALVEGGRLYFEIHEKFGRKIKSLMEQMGYLKVEIHQDIFLEKDRMVSGIKG